MSRLQTKNPVTVAAGRGFGNKNQRINNTSSIPKKQHLLATERTGSHIAGVMLNTVLNSADQAEAVRAVMAGLGNAFNTDDDPVIAAIASGFAVRIVNVLERGHGAIRADGEGVQ